MERASLSFQEQVNAFEEKGDDFSMNSAEHIKGILERTRDYVDMNMPIGLKYAKAAEIMGTGFFAELEFINAFGSHRKENLLPIPFSKAELMEAKEQGEQLVRRHSKLPNGKPLNYHNLLKSLTPERKERFQLLIDREDLSKRHFAREIVVYDDKAVPQDGWALTPITGLPESGGKTWIAQCANILERLENIQKKLGEDELTDKLISIGRNKVSALKKLSLDPMDTYSKRLHDSFVPLANYRPSLVEYIYDLAMLDDQQYNSIGGDVVVRDQTLGNFVRVRLHPLTGLNIANTHPASFDPEIRSAFQRYF